MNQRKQRLADEIGAFVQQYARKKSPGHDPNDRRYDRKVEALVSRMDPEELDEILHGDVDPTAAIEAAEAEDPDPL